MREEAMSCECACFCHKKGFAGDISSHKCCVPCWEKIRTLENEKKSAYLRGLEDAVKGKKFKKLEKAIKLVLDAYFDVCDQTNLESAMNDLEKEFKATRNLVEKEGV